MRDRILLGLAVLLLVGGLTAWVIVSPNGANDDRALYLAASDPPPPIGEPVRAGDARAAVARAALDAVDVPASRVVSIGVRGGTPVFGVAVPGRDAVAIRDALFSAVPSTGLVPVLLGDGHAAARHAEAMRTTLDSPDAIVRRAAALDVDAWARARLAETGAGVGTIREPAGDPRDRIPAIGDAMLGLPLLEVGIALVPAASSAETLAWLAFGNWHGCPDPTTHVAILERLRERVGAEVVAVSDVRIDLRVERPPTDPIERRALAELLVAYAPQILRRPAGAPRTIEDVAAEVVPSRIWSLEFPRPR